MVESKSENNNEHEKQQRFDPELLRRGLVCDLDQYEFLKKCSEKHEESIKEWNEWRERNPNENVFLEGANLQHAAIEGANLQGAKLWGAKLQGADFSRAIVNGGTLIWNCEIDQDTNFEGVGLDIVRIHPKLKQLLEYNIRRMNWEEWYKKGCWLTRFLKKLFIKNIFWAMSDYGRSTGRVITWFFGLAIIFALVYYFAPGLIQDLHVTGYWCSDLVRACYFSIVTMTTLGFGDMYADKGSIAGHILLMIQVILGYVLLGALITRFAVLFTAGGPAGRFADEKKKKKSESRNQKTEVISNKE